MILTLFFIWKFKTFSALQIPFSGNMVLLFKDLSELSLLAFPNYMNARNFHLDPRLQKSAIWGYVCDYESKISVMFVYT